MEYFDDILSSLILNLFFPDTPARGKAVGRYLPVTPSLYEKDEASPSSSGPAFCNHRDQRI